MIRCLCCNKDIVDPSEYEERVSWHEKCILSFWGTKTLPEIDCTYEDLERLADLTVNKGLTVTGVQKKLSLHLHSDSTGARLTLVDYPAGYILKPQSDDYEHLPEAEFLVMKMAETSKVIAVPSALMVIDGKYAYVTKRVDRYNDSLYAMEDFCQLSLRMTEDKYRGSYEGCGKVIKKYSVNYGIDLTEFYYRLFFCFLTGNSDMHLKNFSLIEDRPGSRRFGLSPAYDLLPVNVILPADKEQTALTLNGKKRNITRKDFLVLAQTLDISDKTAAGLINQALSYEKRFIDMIDASYLPSGMKDDFKTLVRDRCAVLG